MKKFLIVLMSLLLLSAMAVPAFAYTDTEDCGAEQQAAIDRLTALEIVEGYEDGSFQPNGTITRAEFAKVAVLTCTELTGNTNFGQQTPAFSDLKENAWYEQWIHDAYNAGMLEGYEDGTFRPNAGITGNEVVTVLMRLLGYEDEELGGNWPDNYLDQAQDLGLLTGLEINFDDVLSRANVCLLTARALDLRPATEEEFALVEAIGENSVRLMTLNGRSQTYELAAAGGASQNDLVTYTLDGAGRATLSQTGIFTGGSSRVAVQDGSLTLNGNDYRLAADTQIYLIDGKNGSLTSAKVAVGALEKQSWISGAQTSKLNVSIQYTLRGKQVDTLIIGGYTGSNAWRFGFIEEMDIYSSRVENGVRMFGDETLYDRASHGDETIDYNRLYQYRVRNNEISLYAVDRTKEQIQGGVVEQFSQDLYNVSGGGGTDRQFIVTPDTVVMEVVYDNDQVEVKEVSYGETIRKGDTVYVRYNVDEEQLKEAAYVLIVETK